MKCFGFSNPPGASDGVTVELCEEIIQYNPFKVNGIDLVAILLIRTHTDEARFVGVWHRAYISPVRISMTDKLLDATDKVTHIFCNIAEQRASLTKQCTMDLRLFGQKDYDVVLSSTIVSASIPTAGSTRPLRVETPIERDLQDRGFPLPAIDLIPFTYVEIGPLCGKETLHLVRLDAHIGTVTFDRLVTEQVFRKRRIYDIYGTKEIIDKIEGLELPKLRQQCEKKEVFDAYERCFSEGLQRNVLVPSFYSIVAMDSRLSVRNHWDSIYTISLRRGLVDLTDHICDRFYEHTELAPLRDRVFWFVNHAKSMSFRLEIEGPLGEEEDAVIESTELQGASGTT